MMRDELLTYYERELTFVRRMAAGFAEKYPKIAGRLLLEPGKSEDPHVERLIESFAFLAARIHLKIDDEFPEMTESLLQILYPHYLAPIPSMSIVQFALDPEQGKLSTGYTIERHRRLYSKTSRDTTCKFRTCYPVTLWPLELQAVRVDVPGPTSASGKAVPAALTLTLRTFRDIRLADLEIDQLRFFLNGEGQLVHRLYEIVFGHCTGVELHRAGTPAVPLGPSALTEVGFSKDEGMLPYSSRSFLGYRLIQEYFHFPEKFLFFDINGLSVLRNDAPDTEASIVLLLDAPPRLDQMIEPQNFRLGCTPVVNLFQQTAEPIRLDHAHTEYRVVPDVRRQPTTEVYAIDAVTSLSPSTGQSVAFQPFYSFKHSFERQQQHTFWHATRRRSERIDDPGTEVFLTLVDLNFRPTRPPTDVITVPVTCTNRDLPGMLPFGDPEGDFDLEGAAPVRRINCLVKPTKTVRPPLRHGAQWRLISHLSLNFLSHVEGGDDHDPEILQEILKLYDFSDSPAVQQQILGLVGVASRQVWRRIRSTRGSGFARGIEATLDFDETRYVGTGVYLFASVLEKFLGLYVSINAFSEMTATTTQRGLLKRWPPPRRTAAAPVRDTDIGLDRHLFDEGYRFEFFQAVRLLERLHPERKRVGHHEHPGEEIVRFRARQSLAFPASEIYDIEPSSDDGSDVRDTMWVNFMGVQSAMPRQYASVLADPATKAQTAPLREFLDLFNHRFISLFYRAWEKYRFAIAYERGGDDMFSSYLYCLIGLGTPGLRNRLHIDDQILLYYAGLLSQRPRSAVALEGILEDYFGVPVEVVQFQGQWFEMNVDILSSLGGDGQNNQLGVSAVLWERIWDPQARFRVNVGPLSYPQFRDFLPGSDAYVHLVELTRFYVGEDVNFDVRPMLRREEVPYCVLGQDQAVRLGWSMWLKVREFDEDVPQPVFGARLAAA